MELLVCVFLESETRFLESETSENGNIYIFVIKVVDKHLKTNNMKKRIFFVMAILTIVLGFTSCKKETIDNNNNNNTTVDNNFYFNVKMDGESFTGDIGDGKTISRSHGGTLLTIKDKAGNNPGFFINILNYTGAKTYEISSNPPSGGDASNASYSEVLTPVVWTYWSSDSINPGTITIISDNNDIVEGTFSFDGYNPDNSTTKVFTEGKFRLKVNP